MAPGRRPGSRWRRSPARGAGSGRGGGRAAAGERSGSWRPCGPDLDPGGQRPARTVVLGWREARPLLRVLEGPLLRSSCLVPWWCRLVFRLTGCGSGSSSGELGWGGGPPSLLGIPLWLCSVRRPRGGGLRLPGRRPRIWWWRLRPGGGACLDVADRGISRPVGVRRRSSVLYEVWWAAVCGRPVRAVGGRASPGEILSPASAGCGDGDACGRRTLSWKRRCSVLLLPSPRGLGSGGKPQIRGIRR